MKTLKDMLAEARQIVPEQGPAELKKRLEAKEPVVVVDVRDPDEYRDGHIEDAANISRGRSPRCPPRRSPRAADPPPTAPGRARSAYRRNR